MNTREEFDEALKRWLEGAQAISNRNMEQYENIPRESWPRLELMIGQKFIRVITTENGQGRSAHSFIDKATGDVLRPDGWKRPAKYARGNIFDESNGLRYIGPHGPAYLR